MALANGPDLVQDLIRPAGSPVRPMKRLFPTRYRIWTLKQAFNTKKQTHARADKDQESSNAPVERTVHMPAHRSRARGGYGGCKYSVPCYLHRTRHVPGVVNHDPIPISSHRNPYSQQPCDMFTANLKTAFPTENAEGKSNRSTYTASMTVLSTL